MGRGFSCELLTPRLARFRKMAEKEAAVNELLYKLCGLYSRDKGTGRH